jgi:hypothetical protein
MKEKEGAENKNDIIISMVCASMSQSREREKTMSN